jgi:hypothetical protein
VRLYDVMPLATLVTIIDVQTSVVVFVWSGSASQIAAGFVITLAAMILALSVRPFAHGELGAMHAFSLIVQAVTLLCGIMLITQRLVSFF